MENYNTNSKLVSNLYDLRSSPIALAISNVTRGHTVLPSSRVLIAGFLKVFVVKLEGLRGLYLQIRLLDEFSTYIGSECFIHTILVFGCSVHQSHCCKIRSFTKLIFTN